ncbi:MAG: hypothetical protein AAB903_02175 [Patescibacteria group bacterium]
MTYTFTWKKILLVALLATFFLPQLFGGVVMAEEIDLRAIANGPKTTIGNPCNLAFPSTYPACFLVGLTYPVGLLVNLSAWMVEWGLVINQGAAYSDMVQAGFSVTLAIANLGFVFAIIVIAIATIIGYESYGLKKNLWKLVAAALLVNFSLVICGLIIGFFDQFAYYFAGRMGNQGDGFSGVSLQLANTLQLNKLASWNLATAGAFFPMLMVIIIAELMIFFTLTALALNLIIRYFYLLILMILMPFAWLAWLIPGMQKHWSSWWEKFIQWAMSPAILLAFVYIALAIMSSSTIKGTVKSWETGSSGGAGIVIQELLKGAPGNKGEVAPSPLSIFIKMFVGLALIWGALIASNSMGAKGASTAMGWSKSIGKRAGNYSARWAKRGGRRLYQKAGGENITKRFQGAEIYSGQNRFLRTITAPLRYGAQNVGYGLEVATLAGTEGLIKDAKKRSEGLTLDQKVNNFDTADLPTRIAWLEEIKEKGRLHEIRNVEQYLGKDDLDAKSKKEAFTRYGKGKLFDEARYESGLHLNQLVMKKLEADFQGNNATASVYQDDIDKYFKGAPGVGFLAETFFQDFDKLITDKKKVPFGLKGESDPILKEIRQQVAQGVAKGFSPSNMSEFFKKLSKGTQLEQFKSTAQNMNYKDENDFASRNWNWLNGNGARNMGITPEIYGIKE